MTVKFVQLTARYSRPGMSDKVYLAVYLAVDKIVAVSPSLEDGSGSAVDLVDGTERLFRESVSEVMEAIHNG